MRDLFRKTFLLFFFGLVHHYVNFYLRFMFIFTVCDYLQKLLKELKWDLILSLGLKIGMMKIYIFLIRCSFLKFMSAKLFLKVDNTELNNCEFSVFLT